MNEIKSFEDACKILGISTQLPDFSTSPVEHQKGLLAHYQLVIIARALNGDWKPNWGNWNEYKYFPWFEFDKNSTAESGFGFSYDDWAASLAVTYIGARLCYKSPELAKYAGQQFIDLYRDYMLLE